MWDLELSSDGEPLKDQISQLSSALFSLMGCFLCHMFHSCFTHLMRRRRSKVSTDRDHFETIDVGNPFSMFQIDSNSTSIQSNCISHDYNDCYNWMPAIRHCGLVYLCHTRIDQHVVVVFRDSGSTVAAVVSHCLKSSSVSMRSFTEFRSHSER